MRLIIILLNLSSHFLLMVIIVSCYNCHAYSSNRFISRSLSINDPIRRITVPIIRPFIHTVKQYNCNEDNDASSKLLMNRRNRRNEYDEDDEDQYYDDDDDDDEELLDNNRNSNNNKRRRKKLGGGIVDDLGIFNERNGLELPSSYGRRSGWRLTESVSKSLLAGVFILGIGLGVTIDSQVNTNPKDLASRDAIDQAAPNRELCAKLGASAMAFDQRVFVSFNPFNVYVAQVDVKPACVLLEANVVSTLRTRNLINDNEVRQCKMNKNTWAYVGDLNETPQLSCVYQSYDAQNEFLSNPKLGIGEDYLKDDYELLQKTNNNNIDTRKIIKGP